MEDLGHPRAEQAVPVLGEAGVVPHGFGERQSHKPTEEEVVFDVLAQPAFRRDGVEDLQELRPQEVLRRDGDSAPRGIEGGKERSHLREGLIHHLADGAQGMLGRDPIIGRGQHDEPFLQLLVPPHLALLYRHLQGKAYQNGGRNDSSAGSDRERKSGNCGCFSTAC